MKKIKSGDTEKEISGIPQRLELDHIDWEGFDAIIIYEI